MASYCQIVSDGLGIIYSLIYGHKKVFRCLQPRDPLSASDLWAYELAFILNQFEVKELPVSLTQFIEYVAFHEDFNEITMQFV